MPAAVMYKRRAEHPRRTGTAWVAVPTRQSVGIGATSMEGTTLIDGAGQGERAPTRRSVLQVQPPGLAGRAYIKVMVPRGDAAAA
jgi:hypothetical protein